jgi:D-threo-aldose 1-dehydrogenase
VSALALGGAPLGNLYHAVDEAEAQRVVHAAYAAGIRYFDTAPLYGSGLSEMRMGRALAAWPRGDYVLSSKVGWLLEDDAGVTADGPYVDLPGRRRRCDYSRGGTLRSVEASLARLGTDRLDIVYVHDLDERCHGAEGLQHRFREAMHGAFPALAELRRAGVVGAVGLGVNEWQVCELAARETDLDCLLLAGRYSLLDQSALASLLPLCAGRGIGVVIGGAYNSGILASGAVAGATFDYQPADAALMERTRRLEAVCRCHGVPLAAAAIQLPGFHPAVTCVLVGARSAAEVETNAAHFTRAIPPALWAEMKSEGLLPESAPTP